MEIGVHVKAKSKWKDVDFVGKGLDMFDDEMMGGLISMQELTDYEIVGSKQQIKPKKAVSILNISIIDPDEY